MRTKFFSTALAGALMLTQTTSAAETMEDLKRKARELGQQTCPGSKPISNDILDRIIPQFHAEPGEEYAELCSWGNVPCGWEAPDAGQAPPGKLPPLHADCMPVRELLKKISKRQPQYSWSAMNGVINIQPADKKKRSAVYDRKIPDLSIEDVSLGSAFRRICKAAQIPDGGASLRAFRQAGQTPVPVRISIRLKGMTAREAFNAIVRKDGKSSWMGSGRFCPSVTQRWE